MDQLIQSYNEKFNLYLTEECLTSLWKNRDIIEYLSLLKKNNCTIFVEDVILEETKNTNNMKQYNYKLQLKIKKDGKQKKGVGAGIIKIEKLKKDGWKISFYKRLDIN